MTQKDLNRMMGQPHAALDEQIKADSVSFLTTAPEKENTDGLKFVVLSYVPETRYDGYVYIITEA